MKTSTARRLWAGGLGAWMVLAGCKDRPECDESTPPACEGDAIVSCVGGNILRVSCAPSECIPELAACNVCGDGILSAGSEECDDGCANGVSGLCTGLDNATLAGDGCESDCTLPRCENGIRDFGELANCYTRIDAFTAGPGAVSVALGDMNNDGLLDVIAANEDASDAVLSDISLLLNQGVNPATGAAAFAPLNVPAFVVDGLFGFRSVAVGNFNNDGILDVAAISFFEGQLAIFLSQGQIGNYAAPLLRDTGQNIPQFSSKPLALSAADLDGDGTDDLAFINTEATFDTVSVFFQREEFAVEHRIPSNFPSDLQLGDMNNDGALDLVSTQFNFNSIRIEFGDGAGEFLANNETPIPDANTKRLALADLDADGDLDAAVLQIQQATSTIHSFFNDGTGVLAEDLLLQPPFSVNANEMNSSDLDQDGDDDLVFVLSNNSDRTQSDIFVFVAQDGALTAQATPLLDLQNTINAEVAVGDLNGDRLPEIVVPVAQAGLVGVASSTF